MSTAAENTNVSKSKLKPGHILVPEPLSTNLEFSRISEEGGWTPLDLAYYFIKTEIIQFLESKGARRNRGEGTRWCGVVWNQIKGLRFSNC